MRFLCVGLNPTIQRTIVCPRVHYGAVNRASSARLDVAGKGPNLARVLAQLGQDALHLCHAGGRDRSRWIEACERDGFRVQAVESSGEIRVCSTLIDQSDGSMTELIEPAAEVDVRTVERVRQAFTEALSDIDVVVLGGSAAPGYPRDIYTLMAQEAQGRGLGVAVDAAGQALRDVVQTGPLLVKINAREFGETFMPELRDRLPQLESEERSVLDDPDLYQTYLRSLKRLHGAGHTIILSQGSRASFFFDPDEDALRPVEPLRMTALNPIGSGDTMLAALLSRWDDATGSSADARVEAIEFANTMAGINASLLKPGTVRDAEPIWEQG